ncbi:MAG TPA: hypothetical protein VFK85_01670 [Anaeromyxobacteraceae bacterium]|nr:hypothetical protein [Anaeromyxobacteraceae bacterium]
MRPAILATAMLLPLAAVAQPSPEYQPNGEVVFRVSGGVSTGASYDEGRVVGPVVNLEESEGGGWIGDIGGQGVNLEISGNKVTGAGVDLFVKQEKDQVVIRGSLFGRRVWVEAGTKKVSGRAGDCSIDLKYKSPGLYVGNIGCSRGTQTPQTARAEMKLDGTAATGTPPLPQFALAIVSVLPL